MKRHLSNGACKEDTPQNAGRHEQQNESHEESEEPATLGYQTECTSYKFADPKVYKTESVYINNECDIGSKIAHNTPLTSFR